MDTVKRDCDGHIYSIRRVIYSYASEADRNEMML